MFLIQPLLDSRAEINEKKCLFLVELKTIQFFLKFSDQYVWSEIKLKQEVIKWSINFYRTIYDENAAVCTLARQACTGLPNKMRIFLRIEEVVSAVLCWLTWVSGEVHHSDLFWNSYSENSQLQAYKMKTILEKIL